VRCGFALRHHEGGDEDTVFAGLRPEPAKSRAEPGPLRSCVLCGHANPAASEFCQLCETVLPEGLAAFARAGDDDTVPGTSRAAAAKVVPAALPALSNSSIERIHAAPAALDDAPTLRLTLADLDASRRPPSSPLPVPTATPAPLPPPVSMPLREEDIETRQMEDWPELPRHPDARPTRRPRWAWAVAAGIVVVSGLGLAMLVKSLGAASEPRVVAVPHRAPAAAALPSGPTPPAAARAAVLTPSAAAEAPSQTLPAAVAEKPRQAVAPRPAASRRGVAPALDTPVARNAEPAARSHNDDTSSGPSAETKSAAKLMATASVQQACSSAGGFLAEQLCRLQQCQRPENARDPVCVAFRRMEEQQGRGDAP
jgi:hypothetical protein